MNLLTPGNWLILGLMLLASLLLATASIVLIGCKSLDRPASASFASARIQGHTPEQIRGATVLVFQVYDRMSYALVMEASQAIRLGDVAIASGDSPSCRTLSKARAD